jgi:adenosine deaminase CECR1
MLLTEIFIMTAFRLLFPLLLLGSTLVGSDFSSRYDAIRANANKEQLYRFLYALPKGGDLHNHFGGSIISEWMWDVLTDSKRNGGDTFYARVRFKSPQEAIDPRVQYHTIRKHTYDNLDTTTKAEYVKLSKMTVGEREDWLNAFRLDLPTEGRYVFFEHHWSRFGDIHRNGEVKFELLADNIKAFAHEGLRYLEYQFRLGGLETNDGLPISEEDSLAMLEARLAKADVADTKLVVRFQDGVLRFAPDAEADLVERYAWVDAHRDRWVGINMAGIEENGKGYPSRFLATYRQLRSRYPTLKLSIHAGEMDSPDHNIRDTLLLGASRIGHGVNILGDPDTLLLLQQSRRTLIEINLISNQLLEYVDDLSLHPFPELLRTGVPVCLNTDDRGMWDSNMTDEYYTAVTQFNLSWAELVELGRNSLKFSFVEEPVKTRLLSEYEQDIDAFETKLSRGSIEDVMKIINTVPATTYGYAHRTWGLDFGK